VIPCREAFQELLVVVTERDSAQGVQDRWRVGALQEADRIRPGRSMTIFIVDLGTVT
jgi:hypothetical protein